MGTLSQRMRHLQSRLLAIRLGSGALALPKDVKKIHMRFAAKNDGGHMGSRKFWREELVRLKYHNPTVPMTIDRTATADDAATLSIHFTAPDGGAERVSTIDMKHRKNSDILERLVQATKAQTVEPTEEDREELRILDEQRVRSASDSKISKDVRARVRREKELLEQARGEIA